MVNVKRVIRLFICGRASIITYGVEEKKFATRMNYGVLNRAISARSHDATYDSATYTVTRVNEIEVSRLQLSSGRVIGKTKDAKR